jgi:hypothetical protein
VLVRGGTTNRAFLLDLLNHPTVIAGDVDTGWLDRLTADGGYHFDDPPATSRSSPPPSTPTTPHAAVDARTLLRLRRRGRPQGHDRDGSDIDLRYGRHRLPLEVARTGPSTRYLVELDGHRVAPRSNRCAVRAAADVGGRFRIAAISQGADSWSRSTGSPTGSRRTTPGSSARRARRWSWPRHRRVGDAGVDAGTTVAVLESMKMETVLAAPFTGTVTPRSSPRATSSSTPARRSCGSSRSARTTEADRRRPRRFDRSGDRSTSAGPTATARASDARRAATARARLRRADDEVPTCVERLAAIADGRPGSCAPSSRCCDLRGPDLADPQPSDRRRRGPRPGPQRPRVPARLPAIARRRGRGLPDSFQDKLRRALADYGVDNARPHPALEEALYRIHLAQQRAGEPGPAILALLERRLGVSRLRTTTTRGPTCATRSTSWWWRPRCATRWSVTSPVACATAASTSRAWSARARGRSTPRSASTCVALGRRPDAPSATSAWRAGRRARSRCSACCRPGGASTAGATRCSRCSPAATTAPATCDEVRTTRRRPARRVVADFTDRRGQRRVVARRRRRGRPRRDAVRAPAMALGRRRPEDASTPASVADLYVVTRRR